MVRFADPKKDFAINATIVKSGGGKGWMKWPFPNYNEGQCDYVLPSGQHCKAGCAGCGAPLYAADKACPCDCDKQYKGLPAGNADPKKFPSQVPHPTDTHELAIEDALKIPTDIPAGDYVSI
jgi:hypothetical protein